MAVAKKAETTEPLLKVGQLINLDRGGRTLQNLEVLGFDEYFVKLRWDIHVSPQTEVVLVPWREAVIGLVGER
ncbi:MAG TPA: hypothetical protein VIY48_05635 [Candidatus Paceibacterota bacterium]